MRSATHAAAFRVRRASLNDKFSTEATFEMAYGGLDLFFGGIEGLLGPPIMREGRCRSAGGEAKDGRVAGWRVDRRRVSV